MRVSLITYAMAIIATVGWVLFLLFGAIGLVALPLGSFLRLLPCSHFSWHSKDQELIAQPFSRNPTRCRHGVAEGAV